MDVAKFRSLCSPIEGRAFLFEEDGARYLAVLDEAGLDRMYIVPPRPRSRLPTGRRWRKASR